MTDSNNTPTISEVVGEMLADAITGTVTKIPTSDLRDQEYAEYNEVLDDLECAKDLEENPMPEDDREDLLEGMPSWFDQDNTDKAIEFATWAKETYFAADERTQRRLDKHMTRLARSIDRLDKMTATDEEHNRLASAAMTFMRTAIVVIISNKAGS